MWGTRGPWDHDQGISATRHKTPDTNPASGCRVQSWQHGWVEDFLFRCIKSIHCGFWIKQLNVRKKKRMGRQSIYRWNLVTHTYLGFPTPVIYETNISLLFVVSIIFCCGFTQLFVLCLMEFHHHEGEEIKDQDSLSMSGAGSAKITTTDSDVSHAIKYRCRF